MYCYVLDVLYYIFLLYPYYHIMYVFKLENDGYVESGGGYVLSHLADINTAVRRSQSCPLPHAEAILERVQVPTGTPHPSLYWSYSPSLL